MNNVVEQPIKETDVFFYDTQIFHDDAEHYYDLDCYDGYAIGHLQENDLDEFDNEPKVIRVEYPKLEDVLKDEELCQEIRDYRYKGMPVKNTDIHYGDVMLYCGKIVG